MFKSTDVSEIGSEDLWQYTSVSEHRNDRPQYCAKNMGSNNIRINEWNRPSPVGNYSNGIFLALFVKVPSGDMVPILKLKRILHQLKSSSEISKDIYELMVKLDI